MLFHEFFMFCPGLYKIFWSIMAAAVEQLDLGQCQSSDKNTNNNYLVLKIQ